MNSEFLTIRDLMSRYQVTRATIFNWLRHERLPRGMKVARTRRWRLSEITAWEALKRGDN